LLERVQATPKSALGDQAATSKSTPSARCAKAIRCEYDAWARHRNDRRLGALGRRCAAASAPLAAADATIKRDDGVRGNQMD
jgi:hypothetical protein